MSGTHGPLDATSFPDVLRAAQNGEEWAASELFSFLHPRLLRYLRMVEPKASEDLAGEVWLAVAHGIREFEGGFAGFRAWVFSIARRRTADYRRRAARRPATPTDAEWFDQLLGPRDPGLEVVEHLDANAAVDLITNSLPEEQAELLLLRVLGELEVLEVAELMGRTPNWVRVTQHRALRTLSAILDPDDSEEKEPEPVIPRRAPAIYWA